MKIDEKYNLNSGIQESFDITLKDTDLGNLAIDLTELGIDSLLNEGIIRDIPVISSLVNLAKFGANIHDKLFIKKILSFLVGLKDISSDDRKKIINEIDNSKKYRIKVGEKLFYIIDSCQDHENSEKISLIFKAFLENKINYKEFLECSNILEKITDENFKWFIKNGQRYRIGIEEASSLVSSGLFEINYDPVGVQIREKKGLFHKIKISAFQKKDKEYIADVEGGGLGLMLSSTGQIVMSIFNPNYKRLKRSTAIVDA